MTTGSGGNAAVCYCAEELEVWIIISDFIWEVNETNFKNVVLKSDIPVLVDCWAPWCMPCRAQHPILEKVADDLQGKVLIASLNTEENRDEAYRLNIDSIPTLVIFKGGEEQQRFIGLQKADSFLGIVTDPYLRTSADGVYAAGDCAEKKSFISQKPTRGEFGTNAVVMARVVAQNIMGRNKVFPGIINANATTVYDWSIGSSGLTEKMALDAGLNVVTGHSEVLDKYPMMDGMSPIRTKLVFEGDTQNLIGGSVMRKGHGAAQNVDFISFAIQMQTTLEDLLSYQYATHPELAAKPSDNTYVFAARDLAGKRKPRLS